MQTATIVFKIIYKQNNLLGGWWETCSATNVTLFGETHGTGPSAIVSCKTDSKLCMIRISFCTRDIYKYSRSKVILKNRKINLCQ